MRFRSLRTAAFFLYLAPLSICGLSYGYRMSVTWFEQTRGLFSITACRGELLCTWGSVAGHGKLRPLADRGLSFRANEARRMEKSDLPNGWFAKAPDGGGPGVPRNVSISSRTKLAFAGIVFQIGLTERHDGRPTIYVRRLLLPLWPMAVLLLGSALCLTRGPTLRWSRRRRGRCIQCGYDLRATTARCPECGLQDEERRE
jgi:hypothetical protein